MSKVRRRFKRPGYVRKRSDRGREGQGVVGQECKTTTTEGCLSIKTKLSPTPGLGLKRRPSRSGSESGIKK